MSTGDPLDFAELIHAFEEGLIVRYPIGSAGEGLLEIDGVRRSVVIRWPRGVFEKTEGFAGFKNLKIRNLGQNDQGVSYVELHLDAKFHPESTLAFAAAVVSQLTTETSFSESIRNSIHATKELLQKLELLPEGKVVGLVGELLFFRAIARVHGVSAATKSWMGPPKG